jgi:hypothetical protein
MKIYCSCCGIFVAEILSGSNIRKNAKMLCFECYERYKIAEDMAKLSKKQTDYGFQDLFNGLFDGKK